MPFDMLLIEKLFEIKTKRKFTSSSSYCISHVSTNWYVSSNFISLCWNVKSSWSNFILWLFMFMNTLLEFLWIAWIDITFWHFDVMHYHVDHEMEMSSYQSASDEFVMILNLFHWCLKNMWIWYSRSKASSIIGL